MLVSTATHGYQNLVMMVSNEKCKKKKKEYYI